MLIENLSSFFFGFREFHKYKQSRTQQQKPAPPSHRGAFATWRGQDKNGGTPIPILLPYHQWSFLVLPLIGGIGTIIITPIGNIKVVYKWYILPIGGLYATYHLLREPETAIDTNSHKNPLQYGNGIGSLLGEAGPTFFLGNCRNSLNPADFFPHLDTS